MVIINPDESPKDVCPIPITDKGQIARERLRTRVVRRTHNVAVWVSWIMSLITLLLIVAGYYTHNLGVHHYTRSCSLPEETGMVISGTRTYATDVLRVLGFTVAITDNSSQFTELDPPQEGMVVVGINDLNWWSIKRPPVGATKIPLEDAHTYVFIQDKKVYVSGYADLCK